MYNVIFYENFLSKYISEYFQLNYEYLKAYNGLNEFNYFCHNYRDIINFIIFKELKK